MLAATFKQLEIFVLVAETGSFAAAAERLRVSSAAISRHVASLEAKLGCELFERRLGTTPVLSARGEAVLREARGLLDKAAAIVSAAGAAPPPEPRARVGAGRFILQELFLPKMVEFQLERPDVQVEFVTVAQESVVDVMTRVRLDLAYVSADRDFSSVAELLGEVPQGLFAGPDHPVVRAWPNVTLPMIMPLAGSEIERQIRSALAAAGLSRVEIVTRTQHVETMVQLAEQGVGVCCAFSALAAGALAAGRLVALDADLPPLKRWAFRRPDAAGIEHLARLDAFLTGLLRLDLTVPQPSS